MTPTIDYHALAPEIILSATIVVVLLLDLVFGEREWLTTSRVAAIGVLAALVPVLTLAADGADRSLFDGGYVVDNYSLALKGFFLLAAYVTILLAVDYIGEGDYYRNEFWFLLLVSTFGMVVMASARDLISMFVALETISLPTFVLAGWRKHDARSNEAAIKYYLIGVLSSAVMLYGMSIIYGLSGSTFLTEIFQYVSAGGMPPLMIVAVFLTLAGFAFKISAVPFHFWAPDTYEGAPTPVTAFLSVSSKAGGFAAILTLVYVGLLADVQLYQPILWVLAALSMTLGNLAALRQTNIVRMLAYSSIAQGGFMLVPIAVAGDAPESALEAVVVYLLIYGVMNLGAFAVVIAVARRTGSAAIETYSGMGQWAPGLALVMTAFLFSLAGIPPLAGWFAKFVMFRAVIDAGTPAATVLGVIAAVNSVIAFFYYGAVARRMWFHEPVGERRPDRLPVALGAALALTTVLVLVVGVVPQVFAEVGELARFPG